MLVGARNLDPAEDEFIAESELHERRRRVEAALADTDAVYVAFDCDALETCELASFMPEPDGLTLDEAESLLRTVPTHGTVAGVGLTGATPDTAVDELRRRLVSALGL